MKKIKRKINKYIEYTITKIRQCIKEEKFKYKDETIKYMFERNKKTNDLIIVFSACTRPGIIARYNYVRTLKTINASKLFILDDFGIDKRGGYYLGKYPNFLFEEGTKRLIDSILNKYNFRKVFFIGSSKGGYAALNFGLLYSNSIMIVGAPQYLLGKFLSADANKITKISMNINSIDEINILDQRLKKIIQDNKNKDSQKIYLHYSNNEHTFNDHINYLIKDLKEEDYNLIEDIMNYKHHSDVSLYYPKVLITYLKKESVKQNE